MPLRLLNMTGENPAGMDSEAARALPRGADR